MGARWPSGLERWLGLATGWSWPGSNPAAATSLRNFANSVTPALPVSFGGDIKSRRSILSGVYARGSKSSHQSALEMCNLSWTPSPTLTIYVDVGHGRCRPQDNCIGKLKWTSTVKHEVVKHSFGSAAEIAEEMGINVSQLMSPLQPEWKTGLVTFTGQLY